MDFTISIAEPSTYTWLSSSIDLLGTILAALLGAIVGGLITFTTERHISKQEEKRRLCELRMEVYADLLRIPLYEEGDRIPNEVISAITVIAIYGSPEIKERVRKYFAFQRRPDESKEAGDNRIHNLVGEIYKQAQDEILFKLTSSGGRIG